jgi:hypothetical protein
VRTVFTQMGGYHPTEHRDRRARDDVGEVVAAVDWDI